MSLAYDNSKPPHVSEVERKFALEQDWTPGAADTLSLWFKGEGASFAETSPGTFTMSAAGADTWGARDEFRYVYKQLDGDGAIAVKVNDLAGMDYWTKAGVMIRESLDPSRPMLSCSSSPTGCESSRIGPPTTPANASPRTAALNLEFPPGLSLSAGATSSPAITLSTVSTGPDSQIEHTPGLMPPLTRRPSTCRCRFTSEGH
jgi:hypothetical protein